MISGRIIQNLLGEALPVRDVGNIVCIPTQCMFPGGRHVVLSMNKGHGDRFILTDDGQALNIVKSAGIEMTNRQISKASELAMARGANFVKGCFTLNGVGFDQIPAAIFCLANLAQYWASDLILEHEASKEALLKERVFDELTHFFKFSEVVKEYKTLGDSNKPYSFDFGVRLQSGRHMLIDVINNHPSSVASAFQRNYDVKKAANQNYIQEGIIENQKSWKAEDLNLLNDVLDGIVPIESKLAALQKYVDVRK